MTNYRWMLGWIAILCSVGGNAQVSGVVQAPSGLPVAGAVVRWPATPSIAQVISAADGSFVIAAPAPGLRGISAALAYQHERPDRYLIARSNVAVNSSGQGNVLITLELAPTEDNLLYAPIKAAAPGGCGDCHSEYLEQWLTSAHAGTAQNPWVNDLHNGNGTAGGSAGYVYTALHDPGETGFCAVCHAPNQNPRDAGSVQLDQVNGASPTEGVNCAGCHQLAHVNENVQALHLLGNAEVFYPGSQGSLVTHEFVWGPLPDSTAPNMRTLYQPAIASSHFCASCHEYENPQTHVPGQSTYSEWQSSEYAQPGPQARSCQQCHMPTLDPGTIADDGRPGAIARPADQRHSHRFAADASADLPSALSMSLLLIAEGDTIRVGVRLQNHGLGHAFPTGVDIRNALIPINLNADGQPLNLIHGSRMPSWASDDLPGLSTGDLAGLPGAGMAKLLAGRINGQGSEQSPVPFIDAERVVENSALQPGEVRVLWWRYANPNASVGQLVVAQSQLLYRRAWRALAVSKGWQSRQDGRPVEQLIHQRESSLVLSEADLDQVFSDGSEG